LPDKFDIAVDSSERILRIRVWGFWSLEEALSYSQTMNIAMKSLQEDPWTVLADVRRFPVQPASVQEVHCGLMQQAVKMGMVRSANIVGGKLTQIQIERLSSSAWPEKGLFGFFRTEAEALNWLKDNDGGFSGGMDQSIIQTS